MSQFGQRLFGHQPSLARDDSNSNVQQEQSINGKSSKLTAVNAQLRERYGRWQARQSYGGDISTGLPQLVDPENSAGSSKTQSLPTSPSSVLPSLLPSGSRKITNTPSQMSLAMLADSPMRLSRRHTDMGLGETVAPGGAPGGGAKPKPRAVVVPTGAKPCFGRTNPGVVATHKLPWIVRHEYKLSQEASASKLADRALHPNRVEDRDYSLDTLAALPKVQLRVPSPTHNGMDLGVSLRFLLQFTQSVDLLTSTKEVVTQFVLPQTDTNKGRYTDVLSKQVLGKPAYFISHCWSNRWYDLAYSVFRWFRGQAPNGFIDLDNNFVWIDIFCVNQNKVDGRHHEPGDLLAAVRDIITSCQATLLCLDRTATGLSRMWCLYETWLSLLEIRKKNGVTGNAIPQPPAHGVRGSTIPYVPRGLHVLLYNAEWEAVRRSFSAMDISLAKVSMDADVSRLRSAICKEGGLDDEDARAALVAANHVLRTGLLESALQEALSAPTTNPATARSGTDERTVDLFCAAHTNVAAWELLGGHLASAARRIPPVVALRLATAEGAKSRAVANSKSDNGNGDGNVGGQVSATGLLNGVVVMDPQLMQVVQMLTIALREEEMYSDVKLVCEAFHVQVVLSGLLVLLPPKGSATASVSSVAPHGGGGALVRKDDSAPLLGNDEDEGLTRVIRAYMHLENCLVEATALGGGWAGAVAVNLSAVQAKAARGAAAVALHDMHARADTVLQCAIRRRSQFRRAIVHSLYNQVVLEYATALPALKHYWEHHRQAKYEMETVNQQCKALSDAHNAQIASLRPSPLASDEDRENAYHQVAARRLRHTVDSTSDKSEMMALHLRRVELSETLEFPSMGDIRSRLAELSRWVNTVNFLNPNSETFLKSLRSAIAVEMIVEDNGM